MVGHAHGDGIEARGGKGALGTTLMVWVLIIFMIVPEGFNYAQDISSTMPTEGDS